jgi:glycosyltransferase involved in cell wall biosynthesis/GT2 family glycosyltransferase
VRIAYVNARYRLDTHDGPNAHSRQFVENTVALGHDVWMWPGREHPLARRLPRSRLARVRVLRTMDVVYVRLEHRPPTPCRWAVDPRRALLGDPLMVWEFNTVPEFGVYADETPSRITQNIEGFRRFGRGCDLAVCVSPHLAEYVRGRLGIERTLVAPNGSDPELYRPDAPIVRHLRDGDPRSFHVLWMGSAYVPWHDFDLLKEAAEIIWHRGNPHHIAVHLIGKDVRLIGEMPPNVHYHGMEEYQRLPGWMSAMHVGLCLYRPGPADYSSPLKLFDYLSSGLAVVATRQPQTAQVLGELDTPDLLIAPHDAEGLADRLEALAGDRARVRQVGRRARDLLVSKYTWRATVTATLAEIERLVSARAGPRRPGHPTRPPSRPPQPSAAGTPGDPDTGPVPVSVCVATYRRPDSLGRLLEGLTRLGPGTPGFEVVVVDNDAAGSAAPVAAAFSGRLPLRLAVEPRRSVAHARNLSVALARGEFVAFIDDDEVPDPRWLAELHAAVSASGADGGFGPVEVRFDDDVPPWIQRSAFFERSVLATGATVPWWRARSGNALIRRSSLGNQAQPFDPRFGSTGGEDTDLFYRMLQWGARFIAVESARVVERRSRHRSSGWWMLRRSFRQGGTIVDVSQRHERVVTRLRASSRAAVRLVAEGCRAVRHLRTRDRAFEHLLNATQSLGMLAVVFGLRYREYGRTE